MEWTGTELQGISFILTKFVIKSVNKCPFHFWRKVHRRSTQFQQENYSLVWIRAQPSLPVGSTAVEKGIFLPCLRLPSHRTFGYFTPLNKKHLKNVGLIRHCEPPHALILHCHSPGVATVARRLRIDVHDNDDDDDNSDNAWQRGPLWPHRMDPIIYAGRRPCGAAGRPAGQGDVYSRLRRCATITLTQSATATITWPSDDVIAAAVLHLSVLQ